MTISIDSNVIAALWNPADRLNAEAGRMLGWARLQGMLVLAGPAYSELRSGPLREEAALDRFLEETGITVDWIFDEKVWREAGAAYRGYVHRRQKSGGGPARRILTDFLIGAHALARGYSLLTFDCEHYQAAFPALQLIQA